MTEFEAHTFFKSVRGKPIRWSGWDRIDVSWEYFVPTELVGNDGMKGTVYRRSKIANSPYHYEESFDIMNGFFSFYGRHWYFHIKDFMIFTPGRNYETKTW